MPSPRRLVPLAALLALAGCGPSDPRLEAITAGITADSLTQIMGGAASDRREAYVLEGKVYEVRYYRLPGAADTAGLSTREMSPVVVVDGQVAHWGWKQWDSLAAANRIQVEPKR